MKKLLVAMLGAVLVLGACGGGDGDEPSPADDANGTEETAGDNVAYDAANGEEVYQGRCAACHGGDLQGASGPGIVGLSYDEVLTAIQQGPGGMPADLATGNDAEDVAAWVADQN